MSDICNAIQNDDVKVVKKLLKNGSCDPNQRGSERYGGTLLHLATQYGSGAAIIKGLVEKGADVDARDKGGATPLHIACHKYGAPNERIDDRNPIKYLVEHGSDVNIKDGNGMTPLHIASQCSCEDMVKYLVKHGADVNARDKYGDSPLHTVLEKYDAVEDIIVNCNTMKYLVEHGADVNVKNKEGMTPLHIASQYGFRDMVKHLVEHGADVNARHKDGRTPLHIASLWGTEDMVKLLVEYGADVNTNTEFNEYGRSLLQLAIIEPWPDVVDCMIEWGADISTRDNSGCDTLEITSSQGDLSVIAKQRIITKLKNNSANVA